MVKVEKRRKMPSKRLAIKKSPVVEEMPSKKRERHHRNDGTKSKKQLREIKGLMKELPEATKAPRRQTRTSTH